jgi:hypothetical protein
MRPRLSVMPVSPPVKPAIVRSVRSRQRSASAFSLSIHITSPFRRLGMPSFSLTVAHRPLRVGFLVRAKSTEDFVDAVGVCTSLWGGLHNPILPVLDAGESPWIETIVRRYQVDVLASGSDLLAFHEITKLYGHLQWPYTMNVDQPLLSELGGEGRAFSLVDVALPLSHYWAREWRHASETPAMLPLCDAAHPLAPMHAANFGRFPDDGSPFPSLEDAFRQSTKATPVDLEKERPSAEWHQGLCPITATGLGLTHHATEARLFDSGCVVGDANDVDHLTFFWNLRAAGADVIFIPRDNVDPYLPLVESHLKRLLSRPSRWGADAERWFHVWQPGGFGASLGTDRADVPEAIADVAKGSATLIVGSLDDYTWIQPTMGNLPPTAEPRTLLATFDERYGGHYVSADLSSRPFSEGQLSRSREWQYWVWSIQSSSTFLPEETTLRLPLIRDLNDWYSRALTPAEPGSLRVQPEGFDLIRRVHDTTLGFSPMFVDALVAKLFDRAGMEVTRSFAGEVTQRVLETMGGLRPSLIFKIVGVRNLLGMERARRGIKRQHAAQVIRDYDPALGRSSFDRYRGFWRDITPQAILDILLERGVFRAGLELQCPKCRLQPFIEADRVGDEVQCPLCGFRFALAPLVHGKDWAFRISGVFEREGSPQGAVPAILAMAELARKDLLSVSTIVRPAMDISLDGRSCETDLIGLEISHEGFPSLLIGECKAQGEIDETDIANLMDVRARLRASGTECYLLFAVMREGFTDRELSILRWLSDELVAQHRLGLPEYHTAPAGPPILFTTQELEADPWVARPAAGPHTHPMSFNDLAENSQVSYLGTRKSTPRPRTDGEPKKSSEPVDDQQGAPEEESK